MINRIRLLLGAVALVLAGCSIPTMGQRPEALPVTFEEVAAMSDSEYRSLVAEATKRSDRLEQLIKDKFVLGDVVDYESGPFRVSMHYNKFTQTGHFNFTHNPGLNGKVTTLALVAYMEGDAMFVKNPQTGQTWFLASDLTASDHVGRLIISKVGDILAAGINGVAAAAIQCASGCGGGGASVAIANALGQAATNVDTRTRTDVRNGGAATQPSAGDNGVKL